MWHVEMDKSSVFPRPVRSLKWDWGSKALLYCCIVPASSALLSYRRDLYWRLVIEHVALNLQDLSHSFDWSSLKLTLA